MSRWCPISAVFILVLNLAATVFSIGVNYGTHGNNLPPPTVVANFLKANTSIDSVKLFDSNPNILSAFANTGISVSISTSNDDIPSLVNMNFAKQWVDTHIKPFYPKTKIRYILVGNEILHVNIDPKLSTNLVNAMRTLNDALILEGIHDIKVTTPHSLAILLRRRWPSTGRFNPNIAVSILKPMLQFLRETKGPFMVNVYPYFAINPKKMKYALFKHNKGMVDGYTKHLYTNSFDALLDTVFSAMENLGYADVPIAVGETGWPSLCDEHNICNQQNAEAYHVNLVKHLESNVGTPLMPHRSFDTYIFALFNENQKPGPLAERNWGLFQPENFTPVYETGIMLNAPKQKPAPPRKPTSAGAIGTKPEAPPRLPATPVGSKKWCVPKDDVSESVLQSNIDYACSQGIDCSPIQTGGACFEPNEKKLHAAFAMNAFYQTKGRQDCHFSNSGFLTTLDPSHGNCKFLS